MKTSKGAANHEESKFMLRGDPYVPGEWSSYEVVSESGKSVIGTVTQRSGGGWICTLPVYEPVDNGYRIATKRMGWAKGYGPTPQDALADADRKALEGITAASELQQMELA